jgi:TonB family protein
LCIADDQAQQLAIAVHQGYVDCSSGTSHDLTPLYFHPYQGLSGGNLACGQKVMVLERYSTGWLKIQILDGVTRYVRSLSISQAPNKFVAFDERSDIPEGVSQPVPVSTTTPEYTEAARKAGVQGACELQVTVGTDGKAHEIKVLHPLGYGLDEKSMEAVHQWQFTPAMKAGKAVEAQIDVTLSFELYNPSNSRKSKR